MRAQAELYYDNNNDRYDGLCFDSMVNDMIISVEMDSGNFVYCNDSKTEYAIESSLVTESMYWCIDSTGFSGKKAEKMKDDALSCDDNEEPIANEDPVVSDDKGLIIVAPKKGDSLCLGEEFKIEWKTPDEINIVRFIVQEGGGGYGTDVYTIGSYPSPFNELNESGYGEVLWKVGEVKEGIMPEGLTYQIRAIGSGSGSEMNYTSEIFSIQECKG